MILIPDKTSKKFSVSGNGDILGNIIHTRNIDFDKSGCISLAAKPCVFYSKLEDSSFRIPLCILSPETTDISTYVVTTNSMFTFSLTGSGVTTNKETGGSPPTFGFQSDACFYQGVFHASGTTTVGSLSGVGGTWTSRISSLDSNYPHPLCVSEHQAYLAVGNGNKIQLYDSGYNLITTCTIDTSLIVEFIRWRANTLYIGTRNIAGGKAKFVLWDGSGTAAQSAYAPGGDWIYSGEEYDSSIAVVTSRGQLRRFNGGGFDDLYNFPIYYSKRPWKSSASNSNLVGKVASRGMVVDGKKIYINLDGTQYGISGGVAAYVMPGGVWVFDPEVGLYHKAGVDNLTMPKLLISSMASSILTLPSAQIFETGDPVSVTVSGLTGITTQVYYAIKLSSTTLKLSLSAKDAIAGNFLTLGGTPDGFFDAIYLQVYRSVGTIGANSTSRQGGIALTSTINIFKGSEVIYGGACNSFTSGTEADVIMSLGMGKNVGSFITPKIQASEVEDNIKKLFAKFPVINRPDQKIIIKYRTETAYNLPGRHGGSIFLTWTSATTFTVDSINYDCSGVAVGNEVEFTDGACGGYTAHITDINKTSTTYIFTIDESMPDVSNAMVAYCLVDNWTKYKVISTVDDLKATLQGFKEMTIGTKGVKWIQMKVELRGYRDIDGSGTDIEELAVANTADLKYDPV